MKQRGIVRRTKELGPQIGRRLRRAIKVRGLSVSEVAGLAHTSRQQVHAILRGLGGNSGVGTLADLARALNVTPCWLCFGDGEGI